MLRMNSVRKKRTDKTVVKEHIVLAAAKSFAQKGVKTVRMDDIAAGLSISLIPQHFDLTLFRDIH